MSKIQETSIDKIVHEFYELANHDILIGYHFRHIEDFSTHIPRIVQFWTLQINGEIKDKSQLPFHFFDVHIPLKLNRGEIFRWKTLFLSVLEKHIDSGEITEDQKDLWMAKIDLFAVKLEARLFGQ